MEDEVWKDYTGEITPFHGLIRVSNLGRVYKIGTNTSKNQSRILKGTKNKQGYIRVHVSIDGVVYNKPVHRLVAEMFCPNPDHKPYVDHINAIRDDNRAVNLRWVTSSENNQNPHYQRLLSQRVRKEIAERGPWLGEANKKKVIADGPNGEHLEFDAIEDLQAAFHTKANTQRILKNNRPVKSHKSVFYGWYIHLAKRKR